MKKNKLAATAMAAALGLSTLSVGLLTPTQQVSAHEALKEVSSKPYSGSPVDLGIANDEKIIEMLKDEGKLSRNASPAQAQAALEKYLKGKTKSPSSKVDTLPRAKELEEAPVKEEVKQKEKLKPGIFKRIYDWLKVDPIEKETYNGEVRKDKVLVLAIDFPDYAKSSITPEETDMFYENYTHEHYQNMIFGENGYEGPNGENLVSMKQYYEQQSGGSYTVEGTVAGWYTADHPAAYYGANDPAPDGSDIRPRELVYEALTKAGQDPNVNLSDYDVWDRDDYDSDGVYNEPDGIIDHLMVIHAGVGEEAGGGSLAGDAIWSHRWNLGNLVAVPGGTSNSDRFGGQLAAYDYTIEPEDGAAGVFAHEFGHDLGLPDEYDTNYTGAGEPVAYWSIMSSGSWAGDVPGTEPTGFSPYAKEYLQNAHGGNWLTGKTIEINDISRFGTSFLLDEGASKGTNNDAIRVNLPDKENTVNTPTSGQYEYFSGSGNSLDNSMTTTVDLTNASEAALTFQAWYDIEEDWDYASVKVNGETIEGNITTSENPNDQNPGFGITGKSDGWVEASFDLAAYAGQTIELEFNYWTDGYVALPGFYVDDINVTADGASLLSDDVEGESAFTLDGFAKDEGKFYSEHYYLLEWRSHNGVDAGLAHIRRGASLMSYSPGLMVWYVDNSYDNNWTGVHPGEGFLGVVDAEQKANYWSDGTVADTRYQLNDAAFSLDKSEKMFLDYRDINGTYLKDNFAIRNPLFYDRLDYSNRALVDAGRNVPEYGLKFVVTGESKDGTVGRVRIFK
ncbi:immune inhibitor A domain-containing protein [Radiobacillus deserti]|uniref:M6 family metalloprotease domain-containing protein n=1 Tax=Radiobacillus deserti TaxID=2594883 RepID=A0A516KKF1_9BACI|nr:immune inhibitor A domain-containing protein [Radiobacillus deserti]QDP41861.1 M6 family metalloprotease domain-containing protein [Radiobacillus deserti]